MFGAIGVECFCPTSLIEQNSLGDVVEIVNGVVSRNNGRGGIGDVVFDRNTNSVVFGRCESWQGNSCDNSDNDNNKNKL